MANFYSITNNDKILYQSFYQHKNNSDHFFQNETEKETYLYWWKHTLLVKIWFCTVTFNKASWFKRERWNSLTNRKWKHQKISEWKLRKSYKVCNFSFGGGKHVIENMIKICAKFLLVFYKVHYSFRSKHYSMYEKCSNRWSW